MIWKGGKKAGDPFQCSIITFESITKLGSYAGCPQKIILHYSSSQYRFMAYELPMEISLGFGNNPFV